MRLYWQYSTGVWFFRTPYLIKARIQPIDGKYRAEHVGPETVIGTTATLDEARDLVQREIAPCCGVIDDREG